MERLKKICFNNVYMLLFNYDPLKDNKAMGKCFGKGPPSLATE